MSGHAYLPPSGAPSWVFCAMWPVMNATFPSEATPESMEGEAAHWGFGELFYGRPLSLSSVAPNGVQFTEEMVEGAQLYVDTVDGDLRANGLTRQVLHVERPIAIPMIHAHNWGTPDTWFGARGASVRLYDFKFGHKYVDAFDNWQMVDYMAGIVDALGINGADELATPFEMVVVQPRNYQGPPVRRRSGLLSDLRGEYNTLKRAAEIVDPRGGKATPGAHCYECPGRHACTALQQAGYKAIWISRQSVPLMLSDDALGNEMVLVRRSLEVLKERLGGLEADAYERIARRGLRVRNHAIEPTLGREAWLKSPEEVIAIGKLFGVDLAKPATMTPKQAIKAGVPESVVNPMVRQDTKGLKLVEDDGRKAAKAFAPK